MKAFMILLCMYMVSLVNGLPIISKPLDNNPDHLVWEALLTIDNSRTDDKTRKIPKSIFITPNLNESKGNCPPDHKLGPDGRCYKTLQIDPLLILKKQIESILKNNRTATTEYDDDYDYSEYDSTESMNSNGQYTVPLSLGFGSDNRIPQQQHPSSQQTTFPNLNRVVKDDAHILPLTTSNEQEKQPFRAATTGFDLGSEDVITESKHQPIASDATTSSNIPSSTTIIYESTSSSSQTSTTQSQSTVASSTAESVTEVDVLISSPTNNYGQQSSSIDSSSETSDVSTQFSSSVKSILTEDDGTLSTDKIDNTSQPLDTTSSESFKRNTDPVSSMTPTVPSVEAAENATMSSSTEDVELSTNAEFTSTTVDAMPTETSTGNHVELIETQNESSEVKLPTLSQIDFVDNDEKQSNFTIIIANDTQSIEEIAEKVSSVEPPVKLMNLKLEKEPSNDSSSSADTLESKLIIVHAQNISELGSTTSDNGLSDKSDSYEVIDAYFIPSQSEIPEEIDPAIGKILNVSAAEPRYRLENASVIPDDELPEAELAPVIDTGSDGRSNIELIKGSDEISYAQLEDEKKNLTARLAEEFMFQGHHLELPKSDDLPTKTLDEVSISEELEEVLFQPALDESRNSEEILGGTSFTSGLGSGSGSGSGGEATTEQFIDYDSKEIKIPTEIINPDVPQDYEGDLPAREPVAFNKLNTFLQPPPPPQPSIYSTFINRLRVAPPFVNLHNHQPDTVQYSHTPFDIVTTIHRTDPDRQFIDAVTTHPTFTLPDRSYETSAVEHPTPVRSKSLQIGINCYLKNVTNKQQYIICDNE